MVTFIKKIKTKEGVNTIDLEKVKKDIPASYKILDNKPVITYTANHIVVAYACQEQKPAKAQPAKAAAKPKAKKK